MNGFKAGDRVDHVHVTADSHWQPGIGTVLKVSEKRVTVAWDNSPFRKTGSRGTAGPKQHYKPQMLRVHSAEVDQ